MAKSQRIKVNDRVYYAQLEMFDFELVGKEGTVIAINTDIDPPTTWVDFDGIGARVAPLHCLEKL